VTALVLGVVGVPRATPTTEQPLVFTPEADARVEAAYPTANCGLRNGLLVDLAPLERESFLRFTVNGVTGTVASAKLRLFVFDGSRTGPRCTQRRATGRRRGSRGSTGLRERVARSMMPRTSRKERGSSST
jgi:hypothetical protein